MNLGLMRLPGPVPKILLCSDWVVTGHSSRLVLIIIRIRLDTAAAQRLLSAFGSPLYQSLF